MAVKYQIPFYDDANQLWRVEIDIPSYSGDAIELTGVGRVFCTVDWGSEGNSDPYAPIINSKVQIQFYNKGGEVDVQELQLLSDMEGRLIIYRGNALWWTGYITPDGIQRMLQPNPYPITINATDGLAILNDVPFSFTGFWSLPVPAQSYAPIGIIRYVLNSEDNLNAPLPLRFQCDVESVEYSDSAIFGTMKWGADGEAWNFFDSDNRKSCGEILSDMLRAFQCRIFQSGGKWNIMRVNDVVDGNYLWTEIADTEGNNPAITTGVTNLIAGISQAYYPFIGENQVMTIAPALTDVVATYAHNQTENIIPNGGLDRWYSTSPNPLYWGFDKVVPIYLSLEQHESLDGRPGSAANLKYLTDGASEDEAAFHLLGGLPLDANILYKRFTLGFQFMPIQFPFNPDESVNWDSRPLKMSVRYVLPYAGGDANFYLNEFGYWQNSARGTDLGVSFTGRFTQYVALPGQEAYIHRMSFEGAPNIGDELILNISEHVTNPLVEYSFVVTPIEEGNLSLALAGLASALGSAPVGSVSVTMQSPTQGYVEFRQSAVFFNPPAPTGSTRKSGAIQDYEFIYPTVEGLKKYDIASIQFQGRGGSSEIYIPDPGLLDGNQPGDTGKLYISIYINKGQEFVLDNINIRVDDNNDVYRSSVPSSQKNTNSQEIKLGISSSFSGHMISNIMTSYDKSNTEFVMTDGKYTGSLTGMTANAMMRFRHIASEVFSGSIYSNGRDWMFEHIYQLNGKNLLPLSSRYNIEQCIIDLTAIECRDDDPTLREIHYGSNDTILSNV